MNDPLKHIKMIHDLAINIDGKLVLSGFGENLSPVNEHFQIGDYEAMAQRANELNKQVGRNVYTPLAVMRKDLQAGKKGGEQDVIAILGFVLDFDSGRGRDWKKRLPDGIKAQYVLETSPDNAQCFIFFETPLLINSEADRNTAKQLLQQITHSCNGADPSGAELSHVWRIPGLYNWPNKKKIREGRDSIPCVVEIMKEWDGSFMPLSNLEELPEPVKNKDKEPTFKTKRKPIGHADLIANDIDVLISALKAIPNDLEYSEWIKIAHAFKAGVGGNDEYYPAFEEWSLQWPDNTPEIVHKKWCSITHAEAGAGTVFYEAQKHGWVNPCPEWVKDLNKDHFVAPAGKDTYVFREISDPVFDSRRSLQCHSYQGFKKLHDNKKVPIQSSVTKSTAGKGTAWVNHAQRRTYENGLEFFPDKDAPEGYYNLWQGWGVKPEQGSWKLMQKHILNVVCGGDHTAYNYFIGWMAYTVQHPDRQGEVAIVIYGAKGVGKNTIGNYFGKVFGQHYLYINNSKHLTGNFNAHLRDAVFVVVDEAFFAGDKQAEGVLKSIITEDILTVEKKGQDLITCRNYMHIMMFSNNDWVIRATGRDERRYFVLHIPKTRKNNSNYFEALYAEMNNGGPSAMLFDLLNYDLSNFNLRSIPQTQALVEQKLRSLDPAAKWLYDCLCKGLIANREWEDESFLLETQEAFHAYKEHHKDHSFDGKPLTDATWSKEIRNILSKDNKPLITNGGRPMSNRVRHSPHLLWPGMSAARGAFEYYIGSKIDWPEIDKSYTDNKTDWPEIDDEISLEDMLK